METNTNLYFQKRLEDELCKKQRTNPKYSMRAFAKYLELDSSELSAVLKNKRGLTAEKAQKVCDKLNLSPAEKNEFMISIRNRKPSLNKMSKITPSAYKELMENEMNYRVIAEWEHYALLSLLKVENFQHDIKWIAKKLDISTLRVQNVLTNLEAVGLINRDEDGTITECQDDVTTTDDVSSGALKAAHKEALGNGYRKNKISRHKRTRVLNNNISFFTISHERGKRPMSRV